MSSTPSGMPRPDHHTPTAIEVWLDHEALDQAERLARLAGDADLVHSLRQQGFHGPDWDFFVNELAKYGIAVVTGWMRRGIMATKCAEKNIKVPTLPDWVRDDHAAIDDIATETVAEALVAFRDEVLVPGVWDPAKGAALRTFFVGQCMRRYANVARRWLKEARSRTEMVTDDANILDTTGILAVEDDAIRSVTAQRILQGVTNPRAARALAMDACGYTNQQIALALGTTLAAAASLIKRARADIRNQQGTTGKGTSA